MTTKITLTKSDADRIQPYIDDVSDADLGHLWYFFQESAGYPDFFGIDTSHINDGYILIDPDINLNDARKAVSWYGNLISLPGPDLENGPHPDDIPDSSGYTKAQMDLGNRYHTFVLEERNATGDDEIEDYAGTYLYVIFDAVEHIIHYGPYPPPVKISYTVLGMVLETFNPEYNLDHESTRKFIEPYITELQSFGITFWNHGIYTHKNLGGPSSGSDKLDHIMNAIIKIANGTAHSDLRKIKYRITIEFSTFNPLTDSELENISQTIFDALDVTSGLTASYAIPINHLVENQRYYYNIPYIHTELITLTNYKTEIAKIVPEVTESLWLTYGNDLNNVAVKTETVSQ